MSQVIGQVWREVVGCRNWPVMRVLQFIVFRRNVVKWTAKYTCKIYSTFQWVKGCQFIGLWHNLWWFAFFWWFQYLSYSLVTCLLWWHLRLENIDFFLELKLIKCFGASNKDMIMLFQSCHNTQGNVMIYMKMLLASQPFCMGNFQSLVNKLVEKTAIWVTMTRMWHHSDAIEWSCLTMVICVYQWPGYPNTKVMEITKLT